MTQGPAEGYRPHLDGLRAVAVYLVLLYHAGLERFGHGFIGVDVFFVLSGYLVTQLLLRDVAQHGGIRLRRFYARRYRRLLPAAFVALMATAVAFTIVATVAEVSGATDAFRASFLYVANWYFIHEAADYFATDIERSPVIHFWSLAVEEQFYLAWPLLLGGLHALTRRARRPLRWIRGLIAVAAVASAIAALQVASSDLSRAYYGTDTRAYQLLAGALLALTPRLVRSASSRARPAQIVAAGCTAGVVVLATAWDGLDTIERGIAITAVTSVLIVAIEASGPAGAARRTLSHRAPVYLGRVSYGTYLWHWPVIVVLSREASLGPGQVAAVTAVVATGLAAVSFHLLERPVRASPALDRRPVPVIAAGLAISIVAGLVLAPAVLSAKPATTLDLDWQTAQADNPPLPDCQADSVDECTVVRGDGAHVLLLGDSNARMYIPTFTEIAQRKGLTLSTAVTPLCPWPRGLFFLKGAERCGTSKRFWYDELIDRLDPDIVVLSQRPMDDPANPVDAFAPGGQFTFGTPEFDAALEEVSQRTVANLRADGRRVVILEPIPIAEIDDDPLGCLSSATDVDDCTYDATPSPMPLERVFRALADGDGTWSLDLDSLVCPRLPTCDPVVDDLIVKRDTNHITGTYARHISPAVEALFEAEGIFP